MAFTRAGGLVGLVAAGALAFAMQPPAHGAGATFTRITQPSGGTTFLAQGGTPTMHVAGRASSGVTAVDVYCLGGPRRGTTSTPVVTGVPVSSGTFSATAPVPSVGSHSPVCRLRAVPQGTIVGIDDLSPFAGPVIHLDRLQRLTQGAKTFNFDLIAGSGSGAMEVHSAGTCGDAAMGTVPADLRDPQEFGGCVVGLGPSALSGAPIRVDGHTALLPYSVLTYADASTSLKLRVHAARNGRVTWTESAPLVRCRATDVYPPPSGQCDTVASTGVTFVRHGTFVAGGHQIQLRDSFASTDRRRHRVGVHYAMGWDAPTTGGLGFAFPGKGRAFHGATRSEVVTGLPRRAATVLVRSDRFAVEGDPQASTRALTWSRPPSRVAFAGGDATVFGAGYSLRVPPGGAARLGFTDSSTVRTSSARALGATAVTRVMHAPKIAVPKNHHVVHGKRLVVKGTVRAGVNGLPVKVRVDGHRATLTAHGVNRASYRVVLHLNPGKAGKHRLRVTAIDAGGNRRSTTITVRTR
jgi:hypothetical protein